MTKQQFEEEKRRVEEPEQKQKELELEKLQAAKKGQWKKRKEIHKSCGSLWRSLGMRMV